MKEYIVHKMCLGIENTPFNDYVGNRNERAQERESEKKNKYESNLLRAKYMEILFRDEANCLIE